MYYPSREIITVYYPSREKITCCLIQEISSLYQLNHDIRVPGARNVLIDLDAGPVSGVSRVG